jgi:transcriptional regulator with XRE-family HTH domain
MPRKVTVKDRPLPRIFAREWRRRAGLSIDRAVEEMEKRGIECSKATISRIERGKQAFTQDILIGFSLVYNCTTLQIQYINPRDPGSVRTVVTELLTPLS